MDTRQRRSATLKATADRGVRGLLSGAGAVLFMLLALAARVGAQSYCCVCELNDVCGESRCNFACGIVADSAACDAFCAGQCSTTGVCLQFSKECNSAGNVCGSGLGRVCDPTTGSGIALCCNPSVAGSHCPPTFTPTFTPTATPTNTPTATPTNTPVPQGGACTTPSQCATGFCIDDVCCNSACTSGRCDLPGQRGTCSGLAPVPALAPRALAMLVALLLGVAVFTLRRRRIRR